MHVLPVEIIQGKIGRTANAVVMGIGESTGNPIMVAVTRMLIETKSQSTSTKNNEKSSGETY